MEIIRNLHSKYLTPVLVLLAIIAVVRILSTYDDFWATWDEPLHIAAGMEWLEKGTWTVDIQHPPLGRVAEAILPYLNGLTYIGKENGWDEAKEILFRGDEYNENLHLGRIAVIPFFLISVFIVWIWSRDTFGTIPALLAVICYTSLPPVLAHSGFATTDMPGTAMIVTTLFLVYRFIQRPTIRRTFFLALFMGLALMTKYSAFMFIPVAGAVILGLRTYFSPAQPLALLPPIRELGKMSAVFIVTILLVMWGSFRFSFGPLTIPEYRPHAGIDRFVGDKGALHDLAYTFVEGPYTPMASLYHGIYMLKNRNEFGHENFIMGEYRPKGVWYYFPLILLVKTPIPFLVFILVGIYSLIKKRDDENTWALIAPIGAALAMIVVSMPSNINIGVRHLLPTYPLFAIIAGYGAYRLWNFKAAQRIGPILAAILLTWLISSSAHTHPNYLTYFNPLAGSNPEYVSVNSDFDWGQDLKRLATVLSSLNIQALSLGYNGSDDIRRHGFPNVVELVPHQKAFGWVAISSFTRHTQIDGGFDWLNAYTPVQTVGDSITLYFIPDTTHAAATVQ